MYQIQFTLKQHTPIIHFQHEQDGATLRATEVKPKLDRFILLQLGIEADNTLTENDAIYKKGIAIAKQNGWLIDKDNVALNYKLKFSTNNDELYYLPYPTLLNSRDYPNKESNFRIYISDYINFEFEYLLPTPYFANSDKIKFNERSEEVNKEDSKPNEIVFAILTESEINSNVFSVNANLLSIIESHLNSFFLINNFGTRQNKGFGSFTVHKIKSINQDYTNLILRKYFFRKSSNIFDNYNSIFAFILKEYNQLKSGTNRPYKKSEIFKYFVDNNIRWEKRFLKKKLNTNGVRLKMQNKTDFKPLDLEDSTKNYYNDFSDLQTNNYKYVRALLGLAENFEFATYNRYKLKIKIKNSSYSKIDRFQSPIFFKIIDKQVYISFNESYKLIEGETFEFFDGLTSLGTLDVPIGFDLRSFISKHLSTQWTNI